MFELFDIFKWYLIIQVLGIIGFILGFKLFSSFTYRSFAVSKTLGLFTFGISSWFLFNRTVQIVPYSTLTLYILSGIIAVATYLVYKRSNQEIIKFLKENTKYIIYLEITFLVSFLILVLLRTYTPNIEGTEKPLEFEVINSILRADYFPPIDAWLAHYTNNYYYLGQLIFCNIIKLCLIDPSVGFNLINPTVLSLIIIGSFEIILELTKKVYLSILAAFMTALMGNLEPVIQVFRMGWNPDTFRWWEAGHVILNSFPEFPYWSFLHSDVHAHFLVHPVTILFLFVLLAFIYSKRFLISTEDFHTPAKYGPNLFYCLLAGSFMLINSWNYPSIIALTIAGLYIQTNIDKPNSPIILNIARIIAPAIFYIIASYSFYLAFYAFYISPVEGLGIVEPATRTTLGEFVILLAVFLLPIFILVIADYLTKIILNKQVSLSNKIQLTIGILILTGIIFIFTKSIVITLSAIIWLYFLSRLLFATVTPDRSTVESILFLIFSLILTCEIIFVNDAFTNEHERQNTVAKSYIQILLLLPIFTAYVIHIISEKKYLKGKIRQIYIVTLSTLIILSTSFLFAGTYVKNNKFSRNYNEQNWNVPMLNGSYYINVKYDGEYNGILWLREHATRKDVILEAEGPPYSHYGRVAAHTGIPSLLNWAGSLDVLRGNAFYLISVPRSEAIKEIYNNPDKSAVYQNIVQYKVNYIFISSLERATYSKEGIDGFRVYKNLFTKVFEHNNTVIYKVK